MFCDFGILGGPPSSPLWIRLSQQSALWSRELGSVLQSREQTGTTENCHGTSECLEALATPSGAVCALEGKQKASLLNREHILSLEVHKLGCLIVEVDGQLLPIKELNGSVSCDSLKGLSIGELVAIERFFASHKSLAGRSLFYIAREASAQLTSRIIDARLRTLGLMPKEAVAGCGDSGSG